MTANLGKKFKLQASQYEFPYHYLTDPQGETFARSLDWGLDYLTYMKKVMALVRQYVTTDVLDVGCGDGFLLTHLARNAELGPGVRALGIDIDEKPIKFAQAFAHECPNVSFRAQDIADLDQRFHLVTAVETFEHIPDDLIGSFTGHIDRLLHEGGTLIVSVPSKARPVLEKHHRHYDLGMVRGYFPAYEVLETHYMTARNHLLYQIVERLLCHRRLSLNGTAVGRALLHLHERFTSDVSARSGAHVVTVLRKP